jgi:hypothetical protein
MTVDGLADLALVRDEPHQVLASRGAEDRAAAISDRCTRAHRYLGDVLLFRPQLRILVLSAADWQRHGTFSLYGMPHYNDERTLVLAANENRFWQQMAPEEKDLPAGERRRLDAVYGSADGHLRLSGFFDLLAVHELAHLFHLQARRPFPRLWLQELFCNLCMQAFVTTAEPATLPELDTFPSVVVSGGHGRFSHIGLEEFERLYVQVGALNYGWYQCHLHLTAKRVFDAAGEDALRRCWNRLPRLDPDISDATLALELEAIHPELARMLTGWPPD